MHIRTRCIHREGHLKKKGGGFQIHSEKRDFVEIVRDHADADADANAHVHANANTNAQC